MRFGVSVEEAASGVYRIVTANIAEAIREVTVKRGTDPRDFALVAFGGAGGQHAAAVAREMEMKGAIFPRNASTFSAFGLLTADLKNSARQEPDGPAAGAGEDDKSRFPRAGRPPALPRRQRPRSNGSMPTGGRTSGIWAVARSAVSDPPVQST